MATSKNNDEKTETTPVEETPVEAAEVSPDDTDAVVYGDSGFDNDGFADGDELEGALGTVREGAYDVPWTYLTPEILDRDEVVRTADSDDADIKTWTVQETSADDDRAKGTPVALVAVVGTPGQTFTPEELPNIESLEKAGINVSQFLSGLPVRQSLGDAEPQRRGVPA